MKFLKAQLSSSIATLIDWLLMVLLIAFGVHYLIAVLCGAVGRNCNRVRQRKLLDRRRRQYLRGSDRGNWGQLDRSLPPEVRAGSYRTSTKAHSWESDQ